MAHDVLFSLAARRRSLITKQAAKRDERETPNSAFITGYERDGETGLEFAQARMYSISLGRFTATDPSSKSVIRSIPQTWNRYTYCYNRPLDLIDDNGKWPTRTHNMLIEQSFKGLRSGSIEMIKAGSLKTDTRSDGKPISTLWPSEAYKHAMTRDGMTPKQAERAAWDFIKGRMGEVKKIQREWEANGNKGLSGMALMAMGEATHVYEDMTSPAHGFEKIYSIPMTSTTVYLDGLGPLEIETIDFVQWYKDLDAHEDEEDGIPTPEQIAATALRSRAFFLIAFGEEKFNELEMSDQERSEVIALADQFR